MVVGRRPGSSQMKNMCERAVDAHPWTLKFVPDHLDTKEMCDKEARRRRWLLEYVPDWFVTQDLIKIWHEHKDHESCDDKGETVEWYDGHQKHKAQKAKIKEQLMPIAWHPSRQQDWCVPEEEKKETGKLWG